MALSAWDKTRVHGTWYSHDGTRLPGTYIVTMPARVTVEQGEAIVPAGVYAQGDLNATGTTDPSLDVMVPSNDDPDVTPLGWQVKVEVNLTMPNGARVKETYVIDTPVGGEVNLRTIPLAQTIPATQTMLLRGVAGGVAALDRDGDVIDADGNKITAGEGGGGASSWDDLTGKPTVFPPDLTGVAPGDIGAQPAGDYLTPGDLPSAPTWDTLGGKPAVIAAGTSQTAARDAIGAGTSNLQLGTGPTTAAAGDHTHSQYATTTALTNGLAGKADTGHSHPIGGVTGLQDALAARLAVITSPTTTRPTVDGPVIWVNYPTQPANAVAGDIWLQPATE